MNSGVELDSDSDSDSDSSGRFVGVKVLYHAHSGRSNSLVPPSEIAETGVAVSRAGLSAPSS